MTKVVINRCFGGFGLSFEAHKELAKLKNWKHATNDYNQDYWIDQSGEFEYAVGLLRDDANLIQVVEQLGKRSWGDHAELLVVDIPDDVDWCIEDYDGREWIAERHRVWP